LDSVVDSITKKALEQRKQQSDVGLGSVRNGVTSVINVTLPSERVQ